jgi:allantoate deiminase
MIDWTSAANLAIERCRRLATYSEEPGFTTRTYLSQPMRDVHQQFRRWLERAGCSISVDAVGNLRALLGSDAAPRFVIASHLDTVPHAGPFDGILGVVLGVSLIESLHGRQLPVAIELIGFSEEEGVRFGVPFIGSRAITGTLDATLAERIAPAIRDFGLDPARIPEARLSSLANGYLEFHIEQGPVLDGLGLPLAVVEGIASMARIEFHFEGSAAHAGTTPAAFRKDALAAAAEWIGGVEAVMESTSGLMATVGKIAVSPGASNVIPDSVRAVLDIRHARDSIRREAARRLIGIAERIAASRGLHVTATTQTDLAATPMDHELTGRLASAVSAAGCPEHRMASGAGHDAMILAPLVPAAMLFLRSPGGLSHHPDENVLPDDVAAALHTGALFLESLFKDHRG